MASTVGALLWLAISCGRESEAPEIQAQTQTAQRAAQPTAQPVARPTTPTLSIAAGTWHIGSRPGTAGRVAQNEAALAPITTPAFEIDRLPYPNDPAQAPRTNVSLAEAEALCAENGKHVCTEIEWERACSAGLDNTYPTGATIDLEGAGLDPLNAATPEGAVIGVTVAEWTHATGDATRTWVRGGSTADEESLHRCASRRSARTTANTNTGFRCCKSSEEMPAYPTIPRAAAAWMPGPNDRGIVANALRSVPELAHLADTFRVLTPTEVDRALAKGNRTRGGLSGWQPADGSAIWRPVQGDDIWVLSGFAGEQGMLIMLYRTADGRYLHGSSMIVQEALPIAVAFNETAPHELLWSTCWGCGAEGGVITRGEDGTYTLAPR